MTIRTAIFSLLIGLTLLALPLQVIMDPSTENIAAVCLVLASSLAVLLYLALSKALEEQPLSALTILGFCMTTQLGALIVQTVAWTPLRSSLYNPIGTFGTLAFYQIITLAVHAAYRFFSLPRTTGAGFFRSVLTLAGIYKTPASQSLWIMGWIGLFSFFVSRYEGVLPKIAQAFNFLTWAPFLIPFYLKQEGDSYCNAKRNRTYLVLYGLSIAVLGLGLNARGIMFTGVVTVALLYVLEGIRSTAPLRGRSVGIALGSLVALVLISGPLSDLATSMAVAREWRGKVSAATMIRTTFYVYHQPSLIAAYRAQTAAASRFKAYDEHYIDNPLLARFVSTKFNDNALHFGSSLTTEEAHTSLRDVSIKFMWAAFPSPVLRLFRINVDKDEMSYSMGDYLAYLSRGIPLGAHRVGSMFGQGIALFGPLFPFVYAVICVAMFGLMEVLTIRRVVGNSTIAALGMLQIWAFFAGGLIFEALHIFFVFYVRNFPQMTLVYAGVLALAQALSRASLFRVEPSAATVWPIGK